MNAQRSPSLRAILPVGRSASAVTNLLGNPRGWHRREKGGACLKQSGRYYGRIAMYLDQHYVHDHRRNELGEARAGVGFPGNAILRGHEVDGPATSPGASLPVR